MGVAVRSLPLLGTRTVAVVLVALTALACVSSFAHAGMVMVSGQDCFGPGCEPQITCARPDQAPAPLRQLPGPVATAGSAGFDVLLPPRRTMPMAPVLGPPIDRPVSPLAPRSPPAA